MTASLSNVTGCLLRLLHEKTDYFADFVSACIEKLDTVHRRTCVGRLMSFDSCGR